MHFSQDFALMKSFIDIKVAFAWWTKVIRAHHLGQQRTVPNISPKCGLVNRYCFRHYLVALHWMLSPCSQIEEMLENLFLKMERWVSQGWGNIIKQYFHQYNWVIAGWQPVIRNASQTGKIFAIYDHCKLQNKRRTALRQLSANSWLICSPSGTLIYAQTRNS